MQEGWWSCSEGLELMPRSGSLALPWWQGDCLMLHPISCTCLATPPAVGHFLSYIRDKFGCYAYPFWNLRLESQGHVPRKISLENKSSCHFIPGPGGVCVMKQIPSFAHPRTGRVGEWLCHMLTLQEGPAAPERGSLTF